MANFYIPKLFTKANPIKGGNSIEKTIVRSSSLSLFIKYRFVNLKQCKDFFRKVSTCTFKFVINYGKLNPSNKMSFLLQSDQNVVLQVFDYQISKHIYTN